MRPCETIPGVVGEGDKGDILQELFSVNFLLVYICAQGYSL
jgi:hypothetical protein